MITELGIVAGEIWHYLDHQGESMLSRVVESLDKPHDTILMSVGWLAREGHIFLKAEGSDYRIFLRKE